MLLVVDGCEPELGRAEDSGPMVFVGAPGSDGATVMDCVLTHTRGWTCLHAFDQATGVSFIAGIANQSLMLLADEDYQ